MLNCISRVCLFATPWTVACQAPLSMRFSRQGYWSGLLLLSPGDLPNPRIEPWSPALQADSLLTELQGKLLLLNHFSCVRLYVNPIDGSPSGSPVPGILQARTLEWVAISFSNTWKWKWNLSVVSDPQQPHGLQPSRLLHPWDFPGKSTGVGCHCLLRQGKLVHSKCLVKNCWISNKWILFPISSP